MRVGIAANPLASLEQDAFRIGEVVEEISGKRVLLLTPALAGQSVNTNSALAKASSVQILDFVSSRESEIVDAFIWLNKNFHEKYDKDKEYDADLGRTYMTRLFSVIKSMINSKVTNSPSADVVILPLFVYPKSKIVGNISIMEAWNSNEAFSQLLRQAQYHEIEVGPILYNAETINALVERYTFNAEKLIILTDQKTPSLERLDYLTWVKRFKVEKETDFVKILRPAV